MPGSLPGQPVIDQRAQPRRSRPGSESGVQHLGVEAVHGALEDRELQPFSIAEVDEETALGHAELRREDADGETVESFVASDALGALHDAFAGLVALVHAHNSTNVRLLCK